MIEANDIGIWMLSLIVFSSLSPKREVYSLRPKEKSPQSPSPKKEVYSQIKDKPIINLISLCPSKDSIQKTAGNELSSDSNGRQGSDHAFHARVTRVEKENDFLH